MTARIVLLGATGYTGARTAEALVARGARPVLAGRDPGRLAPLAERLGGLQTAVADVTRPPTVRALIGSGDVLVTTVGPFLQLGEAAVEAAVDAGAVYLDSTGEPPFVRRVFEEFGPRARESGAALLTAFGLDYVPGTLAGALALAEAGERAHRVDIGYAVQGVSGQAFSRGTFASAAGLLFAPGHAFRDGRLRDETPGRRLWRFTAGGRPQAGVSVGGSEHLTLPPLSPGLRHVGVHLAWFGPLAPAVPALSPVSALAARLPGTGALARLVSGTLAGWVGEAPSAATLARATTRTVAEVRDRDGQRISRVELTGPEAYGLTAALLAWGATTAADGGIDAAGALGPVQAFGLDALTAGAAEAGLRRT
ncbi:NAD(P)H-binding protein [Geodermatophilus sp. YIM 151500]|uniref:saccharopine dehydrogenase family protein n=1 Tax=Geodermatophilus sp. YIM 151500 TaxID=2984531 RepID=UPI0021E418CB|nr:NAD(P)H-binding protein [Geodermatophilus sp. YIM 151500]MCV2490545.1 NAD(P)H-binding protein [Geodermatophilus sp. YIM 151500]